MSFGPVPRWARRGANRILYGARATPYEVLSEFGERVGETYSTEDILPRMAQLLAAGTGASEAHVWLRVGRELQDGARWPEGTTEAEARLMARESSSSLVSPKDRVAHRPARVDNVRIGYERERKQRCGPAIEIEQARVRDTEVLDPHGRPLQPAARRGRGRRPIWPFVATGIAVTAVVVAGTAVLLQREAVPYQADASAITNSLAGIREQGPYVVIPEPAFGTADISTTETREGGTYGLPVAGEQGGSLTETREGGTYGPEWSGASTETREGGTYGLESSGSSAEAREGGAYEGTG